MDEDVWEFIWMKFHSSVAISEKKVLLEALTCSDNTYLLNRWALIWPVTQRYEDAMCGQQTDLIGVCNTNEKISQVTQCYNIDTLKMFESRASLLSSFAFVSYKIA